ncbi:MAG TPA: hypothetical protein VEK33_01890 [Terriglobales bacterium]|nr:hypothetical protein [Terriglobales bacterium]
MKTSLVAIVIPFAAFAWAQQTATQAQNQPAVAQAGQPAQAAPAQAQPPQQKKEIKDPAEYNAYVGAIQQPDANGKISGLEAFLTQYPNSVMKEDALEVLMSAYQQANNQTKMFDTAQRVLQVNPNNLRALALLVFSKRQQAEAGQSPQQNLADAAKYATTGLDALKTAAKPEGMSDADFEKLKSQASVIFNGAAGIAALQNQDYAHAQTYLKAAVEGEPTELRNIYPLALADLTGTPPNQVEGLFFIARAANLAAGSPGQPKIESYGKSQYVKYHGSDQGWTELLATAKANPLPPADFTISKYVPPTPAEQAAESVKNKTTNDIKQMSFADWELVLSAGKPEDQEKVWSAIKGVQLQMEGQVIAATPTEVQIAESQDDIDQKKADIILTMSGTIPDRLMPKVGSTLQFGGTPTSYTSNPFVMNMDKGTLLTAKKPPVHHRPS